MKCEEIRAREWWICPRCYGAAFRPRPGEGQAWCRFGHQRIKMVAVIEIFPPVKRKGKKAR